MSPFFRHIFMPGIMLAAFFVIALSPVDLLGCRTRGIIALLIALISGLSALTAAVIGVSAQLRGSRHAAWWLASTLVLTIPVIALIILA